MKFILNVWLWYQNLHRILQCVYSMYEKIKPSITRTADLIRPGCHKLTTFLFIDSRYFAPVCKTWSQQPLKSRRRRQVSIIAASRYVESSLELVFPFVLFCHQCLIFMSTLIPVKNYVTPSFRRNFFIFIRRSFLIIYLYIYNILYII